MAQLRQPRLELKGPSEERRETTGAALFKGRVLSAGVKVSAPAVTSSSQMLLLVVSHRNADVRATHAGAHQMHRQHREP